MELCKFCDNYAEYINDMGSYVCEDHMVRMRAEDEFPGQRYRKLDWEKYPGDGYSK